MQERKCPFEKRYRKRSLERAPITDRRKTDGSHMKNDISSYTHAVLESIAGCAGEDLTSACHAADGLAACDVETAVESA